MAGLRPEVHSRVSAANIEWTNKLLDKLINQQIAADGRIKARGRRPDLSEAPSTAIIEINK